MVAITRFTAGVAAVVAGGAALIAAPAAALAQPAGTVVVPCDTGALASAIVAANTTIGGATLQLSSNCTYSIFIPATLTDGLPKITGDVTLAGGQNTVIRRSSAAKSFRLFEVTKTGDLTISNVTLANGSLLSDGAAILDEGDLYVTNSTITGNSAYSGGGVYVRKGASATISGTLMNLNSSGGVFSKGGGALVTEGFLRLFNDVIDSNSAWIDGGGLNVQSTGFALVDHTTVTNNSAGRGGGIYNKGDLSLNGSQVRLNTALTAGGIFSTNTHVTLQSTIVTGNTLDNCTAGAFCLN